MTPDAVTMSRSAQSRAATPIGLPTLAKMAFDGLDLAPMWNELVLRLDVAPDDAAALMDLSTIAHLQGRPRDRLALQSEALRLQRVYRQPAAFDGPQPLRLLAFMAAGDFMANIPVEFLLQGSDVSLDMVYVLPGMPLPDIPDHDVALVAVAESDENQPVLREISRLTRLWPRPVVNAADRIARLTRAGTWELLRDAPCVVIPINVRISRDDLARIQSGDVAIASVLDAGGFPVIVRPVDSHAGRGLVKLDSAAETAAYLAMWPDRAFHIAPFIDYRSPDGRFRKYRIALIDRRPYACHMAISDHWMIHYLNADMHDDAEKRAEEARFMQRFDDDFSVRHAVALGAIAERAALDYLPIDCGETRNGKLLVFESGTNMIVHAMDSADLYPYKKPQMDKVFGAFRRMLRNARARPGAGAADA